jgi:hypothetical protein
MSFASTSKYYVAALPLNCSCKGETEPVMSDYIIYKV